MIELEDDLLMPGRVGSCLILVPVDNSGRRERKEPRLEEGSLGLGGSDGVALRAGRWSREGGGKHPTSMLGSSEIDSVNIDLDEESFRLMEVRGEWDGVREEWPESGSTGGKSPPETVEKLSSGTGASSSALS